MKRSYIEGEWINALMRSFANLGLDTQSITAGMEGFDGRQFMSGQRLEVSTARKMWHRADAQANDPLLGLKAASNLDYRAIGVLAPVIWHSPTVRIALNNIATFQTLISESGCYQMTEHTGVYACDWLLEYIPSANVVPVNDHQVLAVIVSTMSVIKAISNNKVMPQCLIIPASLQTTLIGKALAMHGVVCEVVNGSGNFALGFSASEFNEPLVGCDEHLYEINRSYAQQLLRAKNAGLALIDAVKEVVESQGFSTVSIEDAQATLGLHARTLQRNLAEQGTSFRQVKIEVLKTHSVNLLIRQKQPINEVAQQLGYSETSAFHRAFKAWFGSTPKQFCAAGHY